MKKYIIPIVALLAIPAIAFAGFWSNLFGNTEIPIRFGASLMHEIYGGTGMGSYTAGDIIISTSTDDLGRLAIGSATQVLTVSGGVPVWAAATGGSGGSNWQFNGPNILTPTSTVGLMINASSTFDGNFTVGATSSSLFVEAGGGVGIGTDSPTAPLHIVGDGTASAIFGNGSVSIKTAFVAGSDLIVNGRIRTNGDFLSLGGGQQVWKDSAASAAINFALNVPGKALTNDLIFSTFPWTERFRIVTANGDTRLVPNGGNVGINTTGPDRKLDVLDASNPQLRLTHTDGSVYGDLQIDEAGDLTIDLSGGNIWLSETFNATSSITTNATTTYSSITDLISCDTIDTDAQGNLKCGTDESVAGSGGSNWQFPQTAIDNFITPTTTLGVIINSSSTVNANFSVGTTSPATLFVDAEGTGQIGIGTNNPTAFLDVNGDIQTAGDISASADGGTTAAPRVFGFNNLSSSEAVRFQFGDEHNAFQNSYGNDVQIYSYWGLVLTGGRQNYSSGFNAPSFQKHMDVGVLVRSDTAGAGNDPGSSGNPIVTLGVMATTSQTADLTQWLDSLGNPLAKVNASGGFMVSASSTFDGNFTMKNATSSSLSITDLTNCDTIDTDVQGNLKCGSDASGGDITTATLGELKDVSTSTPALAAGHFLIWDADNSLWKNFATTTIDDTQLTAEDFGDWTCDGTEDGCTIDANVVVLTTNTTGNYAAGDAEAGNALTGDTATAFFSAGTIEHEYGGLEANVGVYTGLLAISGGATSEVDLKSELEAQIADVANFAEADGDTWTGVHDVGGATSFEIPNAVAGTVDIAGEITLDTTADQLVYYGGAERVMFFEETKSMTFASSTLEGLGGWSANATTTIWLGAPENPETIVDIYCYTDTGTTNLRMGDGTNWTEYIEATSAGVEDDGTITNGSFTAREKRKIEIGSTTGTPQWVSCEVNTTFDRQ